jgi:putative salt-induced outer membrane protein
MVRPILIVAMALLCAATQQARAQGAPQEQPLLSLQLGFSYVATSGNSDTTSAGLDGTVRRNWERWGWESFARAVRASEAGTTTAERYGLGTRVNREVSERFALTAGVQGERDIFAGLDLRSIADFGVQWRPETSDRWTIETTASLTWNYEEPSDAAPTQNFIGTLLQAKSAVKLSPTAELSQRLTLYPNLEETDDWRVEAGAALQAAVNAWLAVTLSYELRYDNVPVPGFGTTDTTTRASLVVKLDRPRHAPPAP